jgi:outer membrane protein
MKQFRRLLMTMLGITCFTLLLAGVSLAKFATVDGAKVIKEYDKAKEAQTRLEKEFESQKTELKKMNDDLEKQQMELNAKKGIASEKQYADLQRKFDYQQEAFREEYKKIQAGFTKQQQGVMEGLIEDVKAVVAQVAKAENYEAVFDKEVILYGGEDITYRVLDALNRKK